MGKPIYKICGRGMWDEAERTGRFAGAPVDVADGFIHFSTAAQVRETVEKHFAGQHDLVLISFDEAVLGEDLKYEVSRGGALFPHYYGSLSPAAASWVKPLPPAPDGRHDFSGLPIP